MAPATDPHQLRIEPHPKDWRGLVRAEEPVVLSGHQAGFWHPGILAKLFAIDAAATAFNGRAVWLVVDHDINDAGRLTWPDRTSDGLVRREARATPAIRVPGETPTGSCPVLSWSSSVSEAPDAGPFAELLNRLNATPGDHAADQVTALGMALISERLGIEPPEVINASSLMTTSTFATWRRAMLDDPRTCVEAYNAAATATPEAQIRPLISRPTSDRYELPLWRVRHGEPRLPVYSTQLAGIPLDELAPRALLMTGLARATACDLFVHGTGGYAYDVVTEQWLKTWLGIELATMACVTATLRLDLGVPEVSEHDIAKAKWLAQAAKHDPGLIGDHDRAVAKRQHIDAIDSTEDHLKRLASYKAMHAVLDEHRRENADRLRQLEQNVGSAQAALRDNEIAMDRTWPWPIYPDTALLALRDELRDRFREA